MSNSAEAVQLLLERGANSSALNENKFTALALARKYALSSVLSVLEGL